MYKWSIIAKYTFIEGIKDRFFWLLFLLFFVSIGFAKFLSAISLVESEKTFLITLVSLDSLLVMVIPVVYVPLSQVRELESRITYIIFSRPISPFVYIFGKILGFTFLSAFFVVATLPVLGYFCGFSKLLLIYGVFKILECLLVSGMGLLFGIFIRSSTGAIIVTFIFYFIAHSTAEFVKMAIASKNLIYIAITKFLYYLLPSLDLYSFVDNLIYGNSISLEAFVLRIVYGVLYLMIILLVGVIDLSRKEF
jgi:ABC-type transport system involved in multi-copper enzyme maturation permease subunit